MGKRLVMVGDKEAEFLKLAIETWETVYAGDRSEAADARRMQGFNLTRHLEGKYTKAEIEEIAQVALELSTLSSPERGLGSRSCRQDLALAVG